MKLIIGLCIVIVVELIILYFLSIRKRGHKNKDKKDDKDDKNDNDEKENFENPYMIAPPLPNSELTTCQRCPKTNGDVYNGYQVEPQSPASYRTRHTNTDLDRPSTESHFHQYTRFEAPEESASPYGQCNDAYRCRKYGVATGVQGKIF